MEWRGTLGGGERCQDIRESWQIVGGLKHFVNTVNSRDDFQGIRWTPMISGLVLLI